MRHNGWQYAVVIFYEIETINLIDMNIKRIEEIQKETAYPDSRSIQQALLKVWNECEQEKAVKNNAVLPLVMPSAIEQFNCRFHHIQEMVANKGITKDNLISIQLVDEDKLNGDLYKVVHWA